jgi:hypothetical protein
MTPLRRCPLPSSSDGLREDDPLAEPRKGDLVLELVGHEEEVDDLREDDEVPGLALVELARLAVVQLVLGGEPEDEVEEARDADARDEIRLERLDFRAPRARLEHEELRQDRDGLELEREGPGRVRQPVVVERGVEDHREERGGEDEHDDPLSLREAAEAAAEAIRPRALGAREEDHDGRDEADDLDERGDLRRLLKPVARPAREREGTRSQRGEERESRVSGVRRIVPSNPRRLVSITTPLTPFPAVSSA